MNFWKVSDFEQSGIVNHFKIVAILKQSIRLRWYRRRVGAMPDVDGTGLAG